MRASQPDKPSPAAHKGPQPKNPFSTTQQIKDLMEIMATSKERAVRFEVHADQDSKVFIAGSFNNWDPTSHPMEYRPNKGVFRAYLLLEEGTYEYKFVVNGVWQADPKCPERVTNENGDINSVVRVQLAPPA